MLDLERWKAYVESLDYRPLFVTVSGAHLYGFPSPDSDVDLRGSHWPLARGKTTGWAIDDRVRFTPCHNSVMSWARCRPEPVRTARLETLDTLGRSKPMIVQTWAWLIGMSDADDARLLRWAASFAKPPALELDGARLEAGSYVPERRAIRLIVESDAVTIGIKPDAACVNPVFELSGAPQRLVDIRLDGRPLGPSEYAWDGKTLWINATPTQAASLRLRFDRGL
ncbi:MAG: nucleotidyltransferase domain-containing protein [Planctomycetia bacterium]|nr:nucleotidyltransferase domain-containing protein [Planctomycetia bacterium]